MSYQDEFLSPQQVAKMAGCSYVTVLNHINSGKLEALRMGGNFAVRREDALYWMELSGEEVSEANLQRLERAIVAVRAALAKRNAQVQS